MQAFIAPVFREEVALDSQSPPWQKCTHQLVSWWDVEQFGARDFFSIAQALSNLHVVFSDAEKTAVNSGLHPGVEQWLISLERDCRKIRLETSVKLISSLRFSLVRGFLKPTSKAASSEIEHVANTIRVEMSQVRFLHIPAEQAKFYEQRELLGNEVNSKFPEIQFDVAEAGNCFAVGRITASIFHLVRILDVGVQRLGGLLGLNLVQERNWQTILDKTDRAIKALPSSPAAVEVSQAAANLRAVKLAWQGEVMLAAHRYTSEEVAQMIRQVGTFMGKLAKIV